MNDDQLLDIVGTWKVETTDLRRRIQDRLAEPEPWQEVLEELRAVRSELADLRRENGELVEEIRRLHAIVSKQNPFRLSPFATEDHRIKLS